MTDMPDDPAMQLAFIEGRREAKREYFEKVKSQEFWEAVIRADGPEGLEYAQQTLVCLQNALGERSSAEWRRITVEHEHKIEQILGKALGYPPLFPDVSPVDDGTVCVGEHVLETLAAEIAKEYADRKMELEQVDKLARSEGWSEEMNMLPWHLIEAVLLKERRDKQQYIEMLAKVTAPILVPLIDSLNVFLKTFNENGPELIAEMMRLKEEADGNQKR